MSVASRIDKEISIIEISRSILTRSRVPINDKTVDYAKALAVWGTPHVHQNHRNNALDLMASSLLDETAQRALIGAYDETQGPAILEDLAERRAIQAESEAGKQRRRPLLIRMSDVKEEPVRWLWPGRLAIGKLTILAGDPGLSKSTLTIDIAARLTRGESLPGSDLRTPAGNVVILTAEDALDDTVKPRLRLAGANMERVQALQGVEYGQKVEQFHLGDIEILEEALKIVSPVLLVIDPLMAYMGVKTDVHRDNQVRSVLGPVASLCERYGTAGLAVAHMNKSKTEEVLYRVLGSVGFVGGPRVVMGMAADRDDKDLRVIGRIKGNLGRNPPDLGYRLIDCGDHPRVEWSAEPPTVGVRALLGGAEAEADVAERVNAEDFLGEILKDGPVPSSTVLKEAKSNAISERSLARAKSKVGVESYKHDGKWYFKKT